MTVIVLDPGTAGDGPPLWRQKGHTVRHKLTIRKWDRDREAKRLPMPVVANVDFDGPDIVDGRGDVDGAKMRARAKVRELFPKAKLRSLSAVAGGGFSAVVGDG